MQKILVLDLVNASNKDSQLKYINDVLGERAAEMDFRDIVVYRDGVNPKDVLWADKIIAGGSVHSVYEELVWKKDLQKTFDLILSRRIPTHTICFSTQFLADFLGSKVHANPNGHEFGSVLVELTEAGRQHELLSLVEGKRVHTSHSDCIERVPAGATLLARNGNTEVQAFKYENILATQFHTDLPTEAMHYILDLRKGAGRINLRDDNHYQEIKNELELGENSHQILRNFVFGN